MNKLTINKTEMTPILTKVLQDNRLSFAARGFYCFMESCEEDLCLEEAAEAGNCSIAEINSYIRELISAGYWQYSETKYDFVFGSEV